MAMILCATDSTASAIRNAEVAIQKPKNFLGLSRELRDIIYMLTPAKDTPRSMDHPYVGLYSKTAGFPCHYLNFLDEYAEIQIYPVANTELSLLSTNKQLWTEYMEYHLAHGAIWVSVYFFANPGTFSTSKWLHKM